MSDLLRVKDELQRMVYDHDWGGYQKGVQAEQERIIKLLESKLCPCVESDAIPSPDDDREEIMKHMNCSWGAMMIEYHVALIKGEQK